jgi:hypothetical protein
MIPQCNEKARLMHLAASHALTVIGRLKCALPVNAGACCTFFFERFESANVVAVGGCKGCSDLSWHILPSDQSGG